MSIWLSFKHQSNPSDSISEKWCFLTTRVSQVNVNTVKGNFGKQFEVEVTKGPIVLVQSSSYFVSSLPLGNKGKVTQQWSPSVTNNFVLNHVSVNHDKVYVDNVLGKFRFKCKLPISINANPLPIILPKYCPMSILKISRSRLLSKSQLFCNFKDTLHIITFAVRLCLSWIKMLLVSTLSLLKGYEKCSKFQQPVVFEFIFQQKNEITLCIILVQWRVGFI